MSGLEMMDEATRKRFDRLCKLTARRTDGPGLTLMEIGVCGDLARELESSDPDRERVAALAADLGLDVEEVAR